MLENFVFDSKSEDDVYKYVLSEAGVDEAFINSGVAYEELKSQLSKVIKDKNLTIESMSDADKLADLIKGQWEIGNEQVSIASIHEKISTSTKLTKPEENQIKISKVNMWLCEGNKLLEMLDENTYQTGEQDILIGETSKSKVEQLEQSEYDQLGEEFKQKSDSVSQHMQGLDFKYDEYWELVETNSQTPYIIDSSNLYSARRQRDNTDERQDEISQIAEDIYNQPNNGDQNMTLMEFSGMKPILENLGVSERFLNDENCYRQLEMMVAGAVGKDFDLTSKEGIENVVKKIDENLTITENSISGTGFEPGEYMEISFDGEGIYHYRAVTQTVDEQNMNMIRLREYESVGKGTDINADDRNITAREFYVTKPENAEMLPIDVLPTIQEIPDEYASSKLVRNNETLELTNNQELLKNIYESMGKSVYSIKSFANNFMNNVNEKVSGAKDIFSNFLNSYDMRDITNEMLGQSLSFIKDTLQMEKEVHVQEKESEGQEIG